MKLVYHYYMVHSEKKDSDFYYVALDLVDSNGVVLSKGSPILWISEDQYKELMKISK